MSFSRLKEPFQYKKIPLETLSRHKHKRAENTWRTIKRIITYLMDYKWLLVLVIFMVLISSSMGLLGAYLVGMATDDFIDMQNTDGLFFVIAGLIISYILPPSLVLLPSSGSLILIYRMHSSASFCEKLGMGAIAQYTLVQ